jgi:hypothetical protein
MIGNLSGPSVIPCNASNARVARWRTWGDGSAPDMSCKAHELRNEVVASSKQREKYASLKKKELVLHKGGIYEQYR